ncbi:membrane protein [Pseudorhizobium endolithicum]|uniref:Membrane protein n=1 Tax=Pseudorhizobium endolithicum TaxID=1191678 RepID=A0ABM8PGZ7_9HYPH|nr:hypothetical protein [Pseudorhizobium endolithicum]CAD7029732.1 membrane protein [Pseudorhizobium endolithicum]
MNSRFNPNDPSGNGRGGAERPGTPLSATEARQGRAGFPVLKVLIAGIVLVMIAWGVAEIWGQSTEPPAEQTATPPAGDTAPATQQAQPSANPADAPAPAPAAGNAPAD